MTDILIRDLPEEVVAALDTQAASLGLSRNEFLRRRITQEARRSASRVSIEDLRQFAALAADLGDQEVMVRAWSDGG